MAKFIHSKFGYETPEWTKVFAELDKELKEKKQEKKK